MNEVEKMYRLANVQAQYKKRIECKEGHSIGEPCGKCPCIDCDKSVFEDVMPPFTAEKQIELIKWLANKFSFFAIEYNFQKWSSSNGLITGFYKNSLEESIADYINILLARPNRRRKTTDKGDIRMSYIVKNCPAVLKKHKR